MLFLADLTGAAAVALIELSEPEAVEEQRVDVTLPYYPPYTLGSGGVEAAWFEGELGTGEEEWSEEEKDAADEVSPRPSALGKTLREIRTKIVESDQHLLGWDEIDELNEELRREWR